MTKINATKGEFVNLINGLFKVQTLQGKEFGLKVSKNLKRIQEALKDLEEMGTPSEEFMKLAREVNALANQGTEDAQAQVKKLEEENKALVEERQAQMEKVTECMKDSLELELEIIPEDLLPDNITAQQITGIQKIIE